MKLSTLFIALMALLITSPALMAGNGSGPGADPSQIVDVIGEVIEMSASSGSGMPMLTVDDTILGETDVALGPIWFLQQAEFSATPGDQVSLEAYECPTCAAPLVAAWVSNDTTGGHVELRDGDGRPLWTQRQYQRGGSGRSGQGEVSPGQNGGGQGDGSGDGDAGGNGQPGGDRDGSGQPGGSGNGSGSGPTNGSGLDISQIDTITGEVADFTGHAGSGQPLLTLVAGGDTIEITVSPYQPIEAAGLVIEPAMVLTVTFAPTDCEDNPHNVAISILDEATGVLVQLRDPETGFPMTGGNQHNRPNRP